MHLQIAEESGREQITEVTKSYGQLQLEKVSNQNSLELFHKSYFVVLCFIDHFESTIKHTSTISNISGNS